MQGARAFFGQPPPIQMPWTAFTFTVTSTSTRPRMPFPPDMTTLTILRSATTVYRDKSMSIRSLDAVVICSRHGRPPFSQRGRPHDLTPKISLSQHWIAVFKCKHTWPTYIFSEGSATAVYRDKSLDNRTLSAVVMCSRHGRPPFSQRGRPYDITPINSLPQHWIAIFKCKHTWPTSIFSERSATRLNA